MGLPRNRSCAITFYIYPLAHVYRLRNASVWPLLQKLGNGNREEPARDTTLGRQALGYKISETDEDRNRERRGTGRYGDEQCRRGYM